MAGRERDRVGPAAGEDGVGRAGVLRADDIVVADRAAQLPGRFTDTQVALPNEPSGFTGTNAKAGPLSVVATKSKPPGTAVMFSKCVTRFGWSNAW
jgi:hypothetical protein